MKNKSILLFRLVDLAVILVIFYTGYLILTHRAGIFDFVNVGINAGIIAVLLFGITILPGIFTRFGFINRFTLYLRFIRGETGKTMFLFAFLHFCLIRLFFMILENKLITPQGFEIWGTFALFLLLPLFLTSSRFAMKLLGKWWKVLHKLVYIIVWLIFAHIVLIEVSGISVFIGILALAEVSSFIYLFFHKKKVGTRLP
jgi:DMSO/TMAO reductase YedYZ heme-binding membrane subunit